MKKAGDFSQVVLYAKGWFKQTDIMEDLKTLCAEAFLLPQEDMTDAELRTCMLTIANDFNCFEPGHKFNGFMDAISPEMFYRYTKDWTISQMRAPHPDYDFNVAVVNACKSALRGLKCIEGGKRTLILRRPDFKLLPRNPTSNADLDSREWDEAAV